MPPNSKSKPKSDQPNKKPIDLSGPVQPIALGMTEKDPSYLDRTKLPTPQKPDILPVVEIGISGVKRYSHYSQIFEEFVTELSGKRGQDTYQEMSENCSVISSIVFAYSYIARSVPWFVEDGGSEQEDLDASQFIKDNMSQMEHTWESMIAEIIRGEVIYGHDLREFVFRKVDEDLMLRKIPTRAQRTLWFWEFDQSNTETHGDIIGVWQLAPPFYKMTFIPAGKFVLFRTELNKMNPEGRSLIRGCYESWYYWKRLREIEAIGHERQVAGIPIVWVPGNVISAGGSVYEDYKNLAMNIRRDAQEGIVFPLIIDPNSKQKAYDISLLTTQGHEGNQIHETIKRYANDMFKSTLTEWIDLGSGNVGSWALSDSKVAMFMKALSGLLDGIEELCNNILVPKIARLNPHRFEGLESLPKIRHKKLEEIDPTALANGIKSLKMCGIDLTDAQTIRFLRDKYGLPEIDEEQIEENQEKALQNQKDLMPKPAPIQPQSQLSQFGQSKSESAPEEPKTPSDDEKATPKQEQPEVKPEASKDAKPKAKQSKVKSKNEQIQA